MSDNVVLSKHFDSLASAIQRCLSAGYAPTAYIPAGESSVLDTVPSTTDGGMWYELEGNVPVFKMHYGDYDFIVNLSIPRELTFLIDLRAKANSDLSYYDTRGNTWEKKVSLLDAIKPFNSTASNADLEVFVFESNDYLTREGAITLGNKDFTIGFWHKSTANTDDAQTTFTRFYDSSDNEVISVFETLTPSTTGYPTSVNGINFAGTSYTFPSFQVPEVDGVHVEFNYSYSSHELKFFYNGTLIGTVGANLPTVTTARQVIGIPSGTTSYAFMLGEFQLYNGLALHSSDFTPTYTPHSY